MHYCGKYSLRLLGMVDRTCSNDRCESGFEYSGIYVIVSMGTIVIVMRVMGTPRRLSMRVGVVTLHVMSCPTILITYLITFVAPR
jgi:hypothetical protein